MVWFGKNLTKMLLKVAPSVHLLFSSKDRCSAWKLPICCFDSIRAFDYRNCSHIALYPSYIIFGLANAVKKKIQKIQNQSHALSL